MIVSLGIRSYCIRHNDCSEKLNSTLKSANSVVVVSLWSEFQKTQHMVLISLIDLFDQCKNAVLAV